MYTRSLSFLWRGFLLCADNIFSRGDKVSITVQGAPSFYKCHIGVLNELESLLKERSIQSVLVIHGVASFAAIEEYWPVLTSIKVYYQPYRGECSESEISRISKVARRLGTDSIIGVGGGKVLDLVKAIGNETKQDVILIPTLASTCAAWTPLSVIYDEQGSFVTYTIFPRSTYMVLVEPRVILDAPTSYLRAGIGDTLAKWYEAKSLVHDLEYISLPIQVGLQAAKLCRDKLLEVGNQAVFDSQKKVLSSAIITVIEANIVLGGMVGGFGDRYGRIAGAHSIHNALTHVESTHHLLHGEKVAYGILVQLALEGDWKEIHTLLPFYELIGLPSRLEELHVNNQGEINIIAEKALAPTESIHLMKNSFSKRAIQTVIEKLEEITKQHKLTTI